ncbi:histone-lysine N-methyltransferase EHMT1 isoform X2 [Phlebotomus argentipes]|uniref:histone-lysine N-methyltransferase EHMT1 isoform X2 n=1 Tax=Phlebotomus argentipes TaxID=94469 RepID=UPI00289315EF|nr:histone-lysine N-methyltransferase EHMT1 isoform X2 [Phlebotomus argentipes]
MAEFIDSLLNEMSSTFNYQAEEVKIDLNGDRTLKWRSLHHNQYASSKKKDLKGDQDDGTPTYQPVKVFRNPLSVGNSSGLKKLRRARIKLSRLERNLRRKKSNVSEAEEKTNIHVNYIAGDCSVNLIDIKPESMQIFQGTPVKLERRTSRRSTEKSESVVVKKTPKKVTSLPTRPEGTLLSQRPPRRVKPTEKILANKRLRRGFQIHNTRVKVNEALWRERESLATTPTRDRKTSTREKIPGQVQEAELTRKTEHFEKLGLRTTAANVEPDTSQEEPDQKISLPEIPVAPMLCLCQEDTRFYPHGHGDVLFCNAVDQFESEFVGCCNQVDENTCIRRPSTRACFMVLCESHLKRLLSHNCCSGCGIFCTQGAVLLCPRNHFFHRDCVLEEGRRSDQVRCLHCGELTECEEVRIELKCDNRIVFYPSQKTYQCSKTMNSVAMNDSQMSGEESVAQEVSRSIPEHIMSVLIRVSQQGTDSLPPDALSAKNLQAAIKSDNVDRVAEFIVKGFDFTAPSQEFGFGSCLHFVAFHGSVEVAQLILCRFSAPEFIDMLDKEFQTAVICAVNGNKTDILVLLLQYGAKITQKGPDGMTALHLAAKMGNIRAMKILLEHYKKRADGKKFREFLDDVDHGNWTALVWAAELGHVNIESYLVGMGADATICDFEDNTALHWAALSNKIAAVLPLLQTNVDVNHQNVNGDTPLHIACRHLNTQMCLMLLANGSDVHVRNFSEETAIGCIPDPKSQCARIMQFNMQMQKKRVALVSQVVCQDVTNGRESMPIAMVKIARKSILRRSEEVLPAATLPNFRYITRPVMVEELVQMDCRLARSEVCDCTNDCTTGLCQCIRRSSQNCYTSDGRLVDDFNFAEPWIIFECSDVCGCNKLVCKNRVVQNGIKAPMEVFNVLGDQKEWGVRCLKEIPKGTFIAEYIGEVLSNVEADKRPVDSYFFGFDMSDYCIDANLYGNVSRFFNHSCNPNMIPIRVYFDHHDLRFPKIAFFATRNIAENEELTFDYGKNFWKVKQRYFNCFCNTPECRYRMKMSSPINSD